MLSSAGGFAPLSGTVQALALTPPPASTDGGTPDDGGTSDDAGTVDAGDAGPLKTIASAQNYPVEVTVDPTSVYWTASGTVANAFNDGALMKAPIGGGAATPLASAQPTPFGIAVERDERLLDEQRQRRHERYRDEHPRRRGHTGHPRRGAELSVVRRRGLHERLLDDGERQRDEALTEVAAPSADANPGLFCFCDGPRAGTVGQSLPRCGPALI